MNKRLVYMYGINDSGYKVHLTEIIKGKRVNVWCCPIYKDWSKK